MGDQTLTDPSWQGPTATRGEFRAYLVTKGVERGYSALESGGSRVIRTETSYDDRGLPTRVNDLGDVATAADDRCVRSTYVRSTDRWLLSFPSRVETVAVHCGQTPVFPDHAISDSRVSYDGQAAGAAPTVGDITGTEIAESRPASGPVYVTVGTASYDVHGRVTSATDAAGNTTRSAFTPAAGGPVTQTVVTSPPTPVVTAGLVSTTTVEPAFGTPTMVVDPNNRKTETAYDPLGRVVEVWLGNRRRTSNPQGSMKFGYLVRNDAPSVVTTTKIGPNGRYTSSTALLDGLLRPRQVQAPAVGGGRLLTDTRYDSQGCDLRGRLVRSQDPDKGVTTMAFDNADRLTSTRDARGVTLAYAYDSLSRRTGVFEGQVGGTKLAEWVFDTALFGKGRLASATRWVGGNAYTSSVYAYTPLYSSSETTVTIPAVEGALAGSYTQYFNYDADGSLSGESYPAAGGLPRESVNYVLDDWGRPFASSGGFNGTTINLVDSTSYTRYGELQRVELGSDAGKQAWVSHYYDTNTRRPVRSIVDASVARPMQADVNYAYDPAGNVTSIADTTSDQPADVQCFRYDYLRRLTEAWTPGNGCGAAASTAGLAGPAPYWHSYTYDKVGNRLGETQHAAGGDTTRGYTYPPAGGSQPHAVSSVASTGPAGTLTDSYSYDPAGNTTSRTRVAGSQTLAWDAEGHLASVTEAGKVTSFIYTPGGQRLLRKDPSGTTLYLGNQEVRLAAGSSTPTCTRYYTHGGQAVAMRQSTGALTLLAGDIQGTAQVAVNTASMQVTRRRQLPFGAPRGQSAAWPDEKGFVGGTLDASTGLTHLGAREYDPVTGRFVSVDPILDPGDPQQLHGYAYSNNSPATFSDPSGLKYFPDDSGHAVDSGAMGGGGGSASAPSKPSRGPAPVTIVGVGKGGVDEARGLVADLTALARQRGYQTHIVSIDIEIQAQVGYNVGRYVTVEQGIIFGLSFTLLPICVDPLNDHPSAGANRHTRAQSAALSAAFDAAIERNENPKYRTTMGLGEFLNLGLTAASLLPLPIGRLRPLLKGAMEAGETVAPKVLYRGGSRTPDNFTPRPGVDTNGLSTFDNIDTFKPGSKVQVIDVSKLGSLRAIPDAPPPGHVSIAPRDMSQLSIWAATRGTGQVHPFTHELLDALVDELRIPR